MAVLKQKWAPAPVAPLPIARPRLPGREAIVPYLDRIDEARWYANFGPLACELEARIAARLRPPASVVSLSNGTLAATLALKASGARAGTLCALPAWTFVASAHAAVQAGLIPYFLDVDPDTWMLDPSRIDAAIDGAPGEVGAIMPVAPFGRIPDLDAWRDVADWTGLPVVVDGAAAFDGLASAPVPVAVSLHATKTVSAGEGGFVASEDEAFLKRVRQISSFGFDGRRIAERLAGNAKLSEYGAAVALASLDGWPADRRRFAFAGQLLRAGLALTPQIAFQPGWATNWISSVCVVQTPDGLAPALRAHLADAGIETRDWWGAGCHTHPAFAEYPREALPETDRLAVATLGLPYFIDIDEASCSRIVGALIEGLKVIHG